MEPLDEDLLLLRRFATERSDSAFSALVARKIDLVFSAALRQVGGDHHLASEVTQSVFVGLARKAGSLRDAASITGWLYQSTVFEAKKLWRSQTRWRRRQHEGQAMHELTRTDSAGEHWDEIRPLIDDAMIALSDTDRAVVLARYFDGASYAEVGRLLKIPENTARMRAERALGKLRARLERRGVVSTGAALSAALATCSVSAAPAALAATVSANALAIAGGALAASTPTLLSLAMKKQILVLAAALALSAGSFYAGRYEALPRQTVTPGAPSLFRASATKPSPAGAGAAARPQPAAAPATVGGAMTGSTVAGPEKTVEALRVLIDLRKRGILNYPGEIVRYEGQVDPRFAELYGLTPDETKNLQEILDTAHAKLTTLTQANAKVTAQDQNHVVITIAPFPQDGGGLYDSTNSSIAALLGPDRAAAFQQLSVSSLENEFASFGAAERTVTVARAGTADNPYSVVEDTWTQSADGNSTTSTAKYNLRTAGDVARLGLGSSLPPVFQQLPTNPDKIGGGSETSMQTKD